MTDYSVIIPAGRYIVGDVGGLSRPIVAIPARASIFYSDCGVYEIEIAGGGSVMPDENAFSIFGVIEFENAGVDLDESVFEILGFEVTEPTEIIYAADYLEIVGVMKFSVCRDAGLTFTATDADFDAA